MHNAVILPQPSAAGGLVSSRIVPALTDIPAADRTR